MQKLPQHWSLENLLGSLNVDDPESDQTAGGRTATSAAGCLAHDDHSTLRVRGAIQELQTRQVLIKLPLTDLSAIVVPFGLLIAKEEVEYVLAEGLGDQF